MKSLLAGIILLMTVAAYADTTWVAGGSVSGLWNADGSPYMVQGDIEVNTGNTLNIGPGVTVFFTDTFKLAVDSLANLTAEGIEGDSIVFTTDTLSNPNRWRGIQIYKNADTCRFGYCVVENGIGRNIRWNFVTGTLNGGQATIEISHSSFRFNGPSGEGAAIKVSNSFAHIVNCLIEHNEASNGAALDVGGGDGGDSLVVENCILRYNLSHWLGGAIDYLNGSHRSIFRGCEFISNESDHQGGAISIEYANGLDFENCVFRGNISHDRGGGIDIWGGQNNFRGCIIDSNQTDADGGGIYISYSGSKFDRCIVAHNRAINGGGMYFYDGNSNILRCTIIGNRASGHGGGVFRGAYTRIVNTVIAFTEDGEAVAYPPSSGGSFFHHNALFGNAEGNFYSPTNPSWAHIHYLNQNGDSCDGIANIYLNPQFVDTSTENYHLSETSPLIDAGMNNSQSDFPLDPDSTLPDIGAFYYPQIPNAVETQREVLANYRLYENYPNPFNPSTEISFDLPRASVGSLRVYNIMGQEVASLMRGNLSAGNHKVIFDAKDLASGIYVYRLEAGNFSRNKKMILLK